MAWLTSLLNKPATAEDEQTSAEETAAEPPPSPGGPQLAILAPDIAGISSFRLRLFPDAATAAADLEQFPPEMRRGTHAFWALHDEPVLPADGHREALVLIRANLTSDVVYAVSFVDLESAWSFARFETKRGLEPSHLIILWAAFATVREELNGVSILPAVAPATKAQHGSTFARQTAIEHEATETVREYERREGATVSDSAAAPEAPADETKLAEAEAERRAEAARQAEAEAEAERRAEAARQAEAEAEAERRAEAARQAEAEAEAERRAEAARQAEAEAEAERIARLAQEQLRAARAAADAARAQAEAEARQRQETERRLEEQRQAAETAARSRVLADMASSIESALSLPEYEAEDPPAILDATGIALEGFAEAPTQPLIEDRSPTIQAPTDATSDADGEEPIARGTVFAHAPTFETVEDTATAEIADHPRRADGPDDTDDDTPKVPELDEFDIAYEVARLLENRRWSKREEPFQGFESPPGRF